MSKTRKRKGTHRTKAQMTVYERDWLVNDMQAYIFGCKMNAELAYEIYNKGMESLRRKLPDGFKMPPELDVMDSYLDMILTEAGQIEKIGTTLHRYVRQERAAAVRAASGDALEE